MAHGHFVLVAVTLSLFVEIGPSTASAQAVLRHHWPLDETTGLVAAEIQSGSDGRLIGFDLSGDAQWIPGPVDGALDLAAGDQGSRVLADVPAMSAIESGGFSIAMWVRPGFKIQEQGEYQLLFTSGDRVGLTIVNTTSDGIDLRQVLLFWDGSIPNLAVGTTSLEPGIWYHVAVTSSGAGGEKRYYVDGVEEAKQMFRPSAGGVDIATSDGWDAGTISIGAYIDGGRPHDSAIDDVRIYEGVLSPEEVADLAGAQPPVGKRFRRGDANGDGGTDIIDPIFILFFLFQGDRKLACREAADTDDNGLVDLGDAIGLLEFLFLNASPPALPGSSCGSDPPNSPANLGCDQYPSCGG